MSLILGLPRNEEAFPILEKGIIIASKGVPSMMEEDHQHQSEASLSEDRARENPIVLGHLHLEITLRKTVPRPLLWIIKRTAVRKCRERYVYD